MFQTYQDGPKREREKKKVASETMASLHAMSRVCVCVCKLCLLSELSSNFFLLKRNCTGTLANYNGSFSTGTLNLLAFLIHEFSHIWGGRD